MTILNRDHKKNHCTGATTEGHAAGGVDGGAQGGGGAALPQGGRVPRVRQGGEEEGGQMQGWPACCSSTSCPGSWGLAQ